MVSIGAGRFVAIALAVFVVWRVVCWRRRGGDVVRESLVVALFVYLLAVACVTFFPMTIIFYDWHGRFSFVPFASTIDLVRYSDSATALKNIGGNAIMLAPFGLLLPLLFRKLRSLGPLVWRVAVISLGIEVLQLLTRVRATDVDDIILNVAGAVFGYALFRVVALLIGRKPRVEAFLDRVGSDKKRKPLLAGLMPVVATILLMLALIVPAIMKNTLGEGAIRDDVVSGMAGASVVASANANGYVFLVAGSTDSSSEEFWYAEYKRVLPGRCTKTSWSDVHEGSGSCYAVASTVWDSRVDKGPVTYIVGRNDSGASTLGVAAKGMTTSFEAPIGKYFVVVLPADPGVDYYSGAAFVFRDASGRDVTGDRSRTSDFSEKEDLERLLTVYREPGLDAEGGLNQPEAREIMKKRMHVRTISLSLLRMSL